VADELVDLLASTVAPTGLEVLEVELKAGLVRVVVDAPGGADLSAIAEATRAVSAAHDRHDPMAGKRYTLEVTSPGVERPLRTPEHYARAVGEKVSVRTRSGGEGERRFTGLLSEADDEGIVLRGGELGDEGRRFAYGEIERARTVFEWGGQNKKNETHKKKAAS
jgi:ribosome maturation factor RimP